MEAAQENPRAGRAMISLPSRARLPSMTKVPNAYPSPRLSIVGRGNFWVGGTCLDPSKLGLPAQARFPGSRLWLAEKLKLARFGS